MAQQCPLINDDMVDVLEVARTHPSDDELEENPTFIPYTCNPQTVTCTTLGGMGMAIVPVVPSSL